MTGKQKQQEVATELVLTLPAGVATSLQELVHTVGLYALDALLKAEQTRLCGSRYRHDPQRCANRHDSTQGDLVLRGRRARGRKPRSRSVDGQEVMLPTWEQFSIDCLEQVRESKVVADFSCSEPLIGARVSDHYTVSSFERVAIMPNRVIAL